MTDHPGVSMSVQHYVDLRFTERDKALYLQAKEYERRLDELNGAHQKAVERDSEYVRAALYRSEMKALEAKLGWITGLVVTALVTGLVAALIAVTFKP